MPAVWPLTACKTPWMATTLAGWITCAPTSISSRRPSPGRPTLPPPGDEQRPARGTRPPAPGSTEGAAAGGGPAPASPGEEAEENQGDPAEARPDPAAAGLSGGAASWLHFPSGSIRNAPLHPAGGRPGRGDAQSTLPDIRWTLRSPAVPR